MGRWIPPGWNVHRTSSYLSTKKEIANKIWNFYQSGVSKNWWYNFFIFTLVTLVTLVTLIAQLPELCSVNQVRANFVDHPKEVLRVFLLTQVFLLREN